MSYRSLLVLMDTTPRCSARLATAVALAAQHDARLIGLYVLPKLAMPSFDRPDRIAASLEEARRERRKSASTAEDMFRSAAAGLRNTAWEVEDADGLVEVATRICRRARCVDLIIVGQAAADEPVESAPAYLTERLVMEAGRPVLIVPCSGQFPRVGKRVLVAWNQSREAARAVSDAMPILRCAEQVWMLTIDETGGWTTDMGDQRAQNGVAHLAEHSVAARPLRDVTGDVKAGDIILSRVSDHSADLVVLGAYGHSRMRELVLGGVTRDLLQHMTVPVLMSH
jgi:nucleotide-binding universal stress UspA family protein